MSKITGNVKIPEMEIKEDVILVPSKTAVVVVDMQNDFVKPNGKLYVPTAQATVPAIRKLLEKARDANVPIIYTQDWHFKNDPEFRIWGEHCVMNTWGAEIIDELKPMPDDILIRKRRYDAFFGTDLDYVLRHVVHADTLVIVGTVANICVLHTAGSAALNWYNVVVPIDGISALDEFDYYAALRQITFLYKGVLTKVDSIRFR
ncbi:cysteine hydrolase family protein [Vulcanisaeta sp. EB80]|uniref:cysteine hydrolase family protein n=1 Tax=Vulcanisaeta sp. EB80 TaxID=1650660 RepID=UPI00192E5A2C|nr:isochorismatase family cysteine hydrolase [Vulcanisaeta sp. EB80]